MIGQVIGPYKVVASIGRGGMGEVFKGHDQKLNRDVALKILPPELAKDAERLARFQREARVLASLQHQNIAAIYGLEDSDGQPVPVETVAGGLNFGAPVPVLTGLEASFTSPYDVDRSNGDLVTIRPLQDGKITSLQLVTGWQQLLQDD